MTRHDVDLRRSDTSLNGPTVQLEGVFNFPPIPVGNKTERKGLKFLTPLGVHPFRWKHCNENTGNVSEEL